MKTVLKTPEEDNYSFTIQMTGRTGKMRKTKDKNQYHKIIDSATRKLTKKNELNAASLGEILKPAFKEIILAAHLNKHKQLLPDFKKQIKKLDSQIEDLNLKEEIEQYENSFTQLILTTNLQTTSRNPFITIYKNKDEKIGRWRHGIETELPKGKYTVEAITNKETKEKEIELEEPETLHFNFKLEEEKEEDEKDSDEQQEKTIEEERAEKRKNKDFIKAGSKSKTEKNTKPSKITTKRNQKENTTKQRNKKNTSIKKAVLILAAAIIAAYLLSTIL